jgi:glycosyltransferase involved in cell wall biosynthesis
MAGGIAVVASDLPSIREIVTPNEALLVVPGCPRALADGIRHLLIDASLRRRLVENALSRVRDFSWERRAEKIVNLMHEGSSRNIGRMAG